MRILNDFLVVVVILDLLPIMVVPNNLSRNGKNNIVFGYKSKILKVLQIIPNGNKIGQTKTLLIKFFKVKRRRQQAGAELGQTQYKIG